MENALVKVQCPYCGHKWYTKIKNGIATCPKCGKDGVANDEGLSSYETNKQEEGKNE